MKLTSVRNGLMHITTVMLVAQSSVAKVIEETLAEAVESGDHETADHLLDFLRSMAELEMRSMQEMSGVGR